MSDWPLISIVTPCFNRVDFIDDAIKSILAQNYANFEHIIVDGGSTDGTLDVLAKYPHLTVISEPDDGMYDALNKGIRLARGTLINSLNSDDVHMPAMLPQIATCFANNPQANVIFGDAVVVAMDTNQPIETIRNHNGTTFDFRAFETGFQINSGFMTRQLYDALGHYQTRYRVVSDLDFLLRMAAHQTPMAHLGMVVCQMRQHAGSLTVNQDMAALTRRLQEEISMWQTWLDWKDLPVEGCRYCSERCGNACFTLVAWYLSQKQIRTAACYAWVGWRYAPAQMNNRLREWIKLKWA